jgi:hypothetical protein
MGFFVLGNVFHLFKLLPNTAAIKSKLLEDFKTPYGEIHLANKRSSFVSQIKLVCWPKQNDYLPKKIPVINRDQYFKT